MMSQKQYRSCLGILDDPLVEPYRGGKLVEAPSTGSGGAVWAIRRTIRSVLGEHGTVYGNEDGLVLSNRRNVDCTTLRKELRSALARTLRYNVAGADIAGMLKPDDWPNSCPASLHVDASCNPSTGQAGVGVHVRLLSPKREKTGQNRYCFRLSGLPGSNEAERAGIYCALGVAFTHDLDYVMIVNDCRTALKPISRSHSALRFPGAANLHAGLDDPALERLFEDVRLLDVPREKITQADTLAQLGRTKGVAPGELVDIPGPIKKHLSPKSDRQPGRSTLVSSDSHDTMKRTA